jgi:SHS2 domain-containing protein
MPFEEIRHTADWSIRVKAPDFSSLLVEAANGLNAISGITLAGTPRIEHNFESDIADYENLLVSFLSELIFYAENKKAAFDHFKITIDENLIHIDMVGSPIQSMTKAVKAVTFHNLKIKQTKEGIEVEIVCDV